MATTRRDLLLALASLPLASRLGRSRVHLTEVANCTRESARLRQEIASDLGVDVDDIWTAHTESLPQALAAGQR